MAEDEVAVSAYERFKERERAMHASAGWPLHLHLSRLSRSYRVFMGNDEDLVGFLEEHEELPAMLALWDIRNKGAVEEFLDEVNRLLHNYLASAASLRDHTRRIRDSEASDAGFAKAYDNMRVKAFGAPVCHFVQRLRNYTAHWRLPVARGKLSWGAGQEIQSAVNLIKPDLLAWDGWNAEAKAYIAGAPDEIPLKDVVCEYTSAVERFYEWFGRAFIEANRAAFADLKELQAAAAEAWRDATGEEPPPAS